MRKAVSLLAQHEEKARVLAGGTDLLALMKRGRITPECVLNISKIRDLSHIGHGEDGSLRIGALTTIRAIEDFTPIRENFALLYEAAHALGSIQIRNIATIGGNICRASPSAEMAPPLLALDANAIIISQEGMRKVPLNKFFAGPGITVLRANELLTEIQVPNLLPRTGTAFLKISRTCMDLAKVNIAVVLRATTRVCDDVKIAVGAVAPVPKRARKAEELLRGKQLAEKTIEEASQVVAEEVEPITDVRSTAEYRREVSKILVKRAISIAFRRAED